MCGAMFVVPGELDALSTKPQQHGPLFRLHATQLGLVHRLKTSVYKGLRFGTLDFLSLRFANDAYYVYLSL